MKQQLLSGLIALLLITQAHASKFYYKPGDRLPFWYAKVTGCPKPDACNGGGVVQHEVTVESTIEDIVSPNTEDARLFLKRGSCMKREATLSGAALTETCKDPVKSLSGLTGSAYANCRDATLQTLTGHRMQVRGSTLVMEYGADGRERKMLLLEDGTPDSVKGRVAMETFKALCPLEYININNSAED